MMHHIRLPAVVVLGVGVLALSTAANAHGCRRAEAWSLWREIPAERIAPNVYVVHAPAGRSPFPYAGRSAYRPPWWARYWSW